MGEDRYFHKAWDVCKQMVRDRGYSLSPDYEKLSQIEKVKEEKIRLVRRNMEDLNDTYAKFLH